MTPLTLTLTSTSLPVTIQDREGNNIDMELAEMTAALRDSYLGKVSLRMRRTEDGKVAGLEKFDGMQAELVTLCLRRKDTGVFVPASEIQAWPSSAVQQLYKAAQDMNHLGDQQEKKVEEIKNV